MKQDEVNKKAYRENLIMGHTDFEWSEESKTGEKVEKTRGIGGEKWMQKGIKPQEKGEMKRNERRSI